MRRRISLLLLALALTAGACTDAGELGGPAIGGTDAAVIGDVAISAADLEAETELWALNPEFLRIVGVTDTGRPGVRSQALVTFVLSHRIVSEQARQLVTAAGIEPSEAEVDEILAAVDAQFTTPEGGSLFAVYPEEFRRRLGRDLVFQNNLQGVAQGPFEAPPVQVSSRYGQAQPDQLGIVSVVPPTGPRPAPLELPDPAGA